MSAVLRCDQCGQVASEMSWNWWRIERVAGFRDYGEPAELHFDSAECVSDYFVAHYTLKGTA